MTVNYPKSMFGNLIDIYKLHITIPRTDGRSNKILKAQLLQINISELIINMYFLIIISDQGQVMLIFSSEATL